MPEKTYPVIDYPIHGKHNGANKRLKFIFPILCVQIGFSVAGYFVGL